MYRIERSKSTVMAEEYGGDCDGSIVTDGVGLGKFGIMLDNQKETYIAIFIGRGNRDVINTDGACMMHEGLSDRGMRKGLGGATIFLALRTFRDKVLNDTHGDAVPRVFLAEG